VSARRIVAGCLLVGIGVAGFSVTTSAGAADGPSAFFAIANADGVHAMIEMKGYTVVDQLLDAGLPSAQATIDSLGTSAAYAAEPYPGDLVLTAPGTGAIATGGVCGPLKLSPCPAIPDYPLIAQSTFPGQDSGSIDGAVTKLSAHSTDSSSSSNAETGLGDPATASGGRSTIASNVHHETATGAVAASAESTVESLTLADVLRIGRAHASAKVTQAVGGSLTRESSLDVTGVTIAGQAVGLTDQGLLLAGTSTPLPPTSPLLGILADRGITVRYLAPETTPTGVVAPGIEVSFPVTIPTAPKPAQASYVLGRASAFGSAGGIGVAAGGGGGGIDSSVGDASLAPPGRSLADGSTASLSAVATPVSSRAPAVGRAGARQRTIAFARPGGATGLVPADWSVGFYLVLVVAGLVTLGGAQLFRILGVRVAWTE